MNYFGKLLRLPQRLLTFLFSRPVMVAFMIVLQVAFFVLPGVIISPFFKPLSLFLKGLSILAVFLLVSKDENPYFKISWLCLITFFPQGGGIIYFLLAHRRMPDKLERYMRAHLEDIGSLFPGAPLLEPVDPDSQVQSQYVRQLSGYPVTGDTGVEYYSEGAQMVAAMMDSIRQAKHYLFLEFFIVKEGVVLTSLLHLLQEKIAQGVSVYFIYDDVGTMFALPVGYKKYLEEMGLRICVFNPFRPHVSPMLHYRDHRKIVVVDGAVAFCGGINLADEYTNQEIRFGHWKDTGVKLTGKGAWTFALMFLQQWQFGTGEALDIPSFSPQALPQVAPDGLVQVYGDSPLTKYNIAENVYLNAIRQAKKYLYIATPYVVIDNAMEDALCAAAAAGVDVRISTPYIYDKWYVHILTRSHYSKLIAEGVKIYEYTPGFMHSKMFVADDTIAMVGTSNLDFRSFYHHFECSVLLYENSRIGQIKEDLREIQEQSHLVTLEETKNISLWEWLLQKVLKLFAPLL